MSKIEQISKRLNNMVGNAQRMAALNQAMMRNEFVKTTVVLKQYEKIANEEAMKLSEMDRGLDPKKYEDQLLIVKDKQLKYQTALNTQAEYKAAMAESGMPDDGYLKM